ncbi:MAG: site-2 protease family protein [Anaerolineae bacterium]|jgi:membrane-associated protease RseP (regulator of RpoE activity)
MAATSPEGQSTIERLRRQLMPYMEIDEYEIMKPPSSLIAFRGRVKGDTATAFDRVSQAFETMGYTAILRTTDEGRHKVLVVQGVHDEEPSNPLVNVTLFAATLLTVLFIGAANALQYAEQFHGMEVSYDILTILSNLHRGIPFAATLMGILLAHELSHYLVARRYGSPVSLPYFIPMPNLLGTMGAVITQKAPMRDRKALFDIGIAGPLGGLAVAIPLLILGLSTSTVQAPPVGLDQALQEGNSLLYIAAKYLIFGRFLPSNGQDVWINGVAFAAWAGLLVTMINLIPVGQLDGGHVSYAVLGHRAWALGYVLIAAMFGWGGFLLFLGNQAGGFWLLWGFINLLLNRKHPPPLNDVTPISRGRVVVGILMLVIFILTFMPSPLQTVTF